LKFPLKSKVYLDLNKKYFVITANEDLLFDHMFNLLYNLWYHNSSIVNHNSKILIY